MFTSEICPCLQIVLVIIYLLIWIWITPIYFTSTCVFATCVQWQHATQLSGGGSAWQHNLWALLKYIPISATSSELNITNFLPWIYEHIWIIKRALTPWFFHDEETFQVSWFELLCIHDIYFKSHFYLAMNSQQVNRDTLNVTVTQKNSSGHKHLLNSCKWL